MEQMSFLSLSLSQREIPQRIKKKPFSFCIQVFCFTPSISVQSQVWQDNATTLSWVFFLCTQPHTQEQVREFFPPPPFLLPPPFHPQTDHFPHFPPSPLFFFFFLFDIASGFMGQSSPASFLSRSLLLSPDFAEARQGFHQFSEKSERKTILFVRVKNIAISTTHRVKVNPAPTQDPPRPTIINNGWEGSKTEGEREEGVWMGEKRRSGSFSFSFSFRYSGVKFWVKVAAEVAEEFSLMEGEERRL